LADLPHPAPRSISERHETPAPKPAQPRREEREHALASPASTIDGDQEQESINPLVANAAFPAEVEARREAARDRIKQRRGQRNKRKMKAYELALALGMLAVGAIGATYLGWYLLKTPHVRETTAEAVPPADPADWATRPTSILERDFAPKPVPKRLVGVWELRSDDDRRGWIEYRSDSTMVARAWKGNEESAPESTNWYLVQELGDDFEIELGPERGGLRNVRFFLSLSGDDAYTLTQVFKNGVRRREDQRFVRRAASVAPP